MTISISSYNNLIMSGQTESSRLCTSQMSKKEKMTAIRFLLAIPPESWMNIRSLPDYVFSYIYEVGTLVDLPWLRFDENELGQDIRRRRVTENGVKVAGMIKGSPLFNKLGFDDVILMLYYEHIGLDKFENLLLAFCQKHSFNHQSIF